MKTILFLSILLFPIAVMAGEPKKDPMTVEMIEGQTGKSYSLITPISSDKKTLEESYADIRKKAAKLGADAVIELNCMAQAGLNQAGAGPGLFAFVKTTSKVNAICQGKAVKWTP